MNFSLLLTYIRRAFPISRKRLEEMTADRNKWRDDARSQQETIHELRNETRQMRAKVEYRNIQLDMVKREVAELRGQPIPQYTTANLEIPKIAYVPMFAEYPFAESFTQCMEMAGAASGHATLTEVIRVAYTPGQFDRS